MTSARFRHRSVREVTAARAMIADAADAAIDAHMGAVSALRLLASGDISDVGDALEIYAAAIDSEREIERTQTIMAAVLLLFGCTKHGVAEAAHCRVSTLSRRIAAVREAADIAAAKRADLVQSGDGSWTVQPRAAAAPTPATRRRPLPRAEL